MFLWKFITTAFKGNFLSFTNSRTCQGCLSLSQIQTRMFPKRRKNAPIAKEHNSNKSNETIMMQLAVPSSLTQQALVIQTCCASCSPHVCWPLQVAEGELSFSGLPACKRQTDLGLPAPWCKDKQTNTPESKEISSLHKPGQELWV